MKPLTRRRVFVPALNALGLILLGCAARAPGAAVSQASAASIEASRLSATLHAELLEPVSNAASTVVWGEAFDALNGDAWRNVEVTNRNTFESVDLEGRRCLRVDTQNSASLLVHTMMIDPSAVPWLSWEWRVDAFVPGESLHEKSGSDASARVYVYFDTLGLPWQKRNIDYVWSKTLPVGTVLDSPYSAASKIIVASSGTGNQGKWVKQVHNIDEDYRRCFGGKSPKVVAIGLMADTDSAGGSGLAFFDDLRLTQQHPDVSNGTDSNIWKK